jgi:branched-subunit amino acid ABC-type transport system permease component
MEFIQLIVNGVIAGILLAVPAIGFTLIFGVLRFANFALMSHITVGAFAGYVANVGLSLPMAPSLAVAFVVAGLVGVIGDEVVLKPIRPHGPLATAITSVALLFVVENLVRFGFGNELRTYDLPLYRDWLVLGLHLGPLQLQNAVLALAVMLAVFLFLAFTRAGKAMRAVADNPALADLNGIDPHRIGRYVSFAGMGLAGVGGVLLGYDTSIDPLTGFRVALAIFAATVVGGLGSIPGAVVGAILIGVAEELSLLVVAPTYKTAVGFIAVLLVLGLRPGGLFGMREGNG